MLCVHSADAQTLTGLTPTHAGISPLGVVRLAHTRAHATMAFANYALEHFGHASERSRAQLITPRRARVFGSLALCYLLMRLMCRTSLCVTHAQRAVYASICVVAVVAENVSKHCTHTHTLIAHRADRKERGLKTRPHRCRRLIVAQFAINMSNGTSENCIPLNIMHTHVPISNGFIIDFNVSVCLCMCARTNVCKCR